MKARLKTISVTTRIRAFSLIEVLITVAILSTAIIFLLRAFASSLSAAQFSQNLTLACYLAEEKIFEAQNSFAYKKANTDEGSQEIQGRDFKWRYALTDSTKKGLKNLELTVFWKEKVRSKEYSSLFSLLLPEAGP